MTHDDDNDRIITGPRPHNVMRGDSPLGGYCHPVSPEKTRLKSIVIPVDLSLTTHIYSTTKGPDRKLNSEEELRVYRVK